MSRASLGAPDESCRVDDAKSSHYLTHRQVGLAYEKLKAGGFRQVAVIDEGKLIGILTDRDLGEHIERPNDIPVDAVMAALPLTVRSCTPVERAAHL